MKTVAEWPVTEKSRDMVYALWSSAFPAIPTASKQSFVSSLNYKKPPKSISSVVSALKGEATLYFDSSRDEIRKDVTAEVSSTFIVLAAAAAVGLFIALS